MGKSDYDTDEEEGYYSSDSEKSDILSDSFDADDTDEDDSGRESEEDDEKAKDYSSEEEPETKPVPKRPLKLIKKPVSVKKEEKKPANPLPSTGSILSSMKDKDASSQKKPLNVESLSPEKHRPKTESKADSSEINKKSPSAAPKKLPNSGTGIKPVRPSLPTSLSKSKTETKTPTRPSLPTSLSKPKTETKTSTRPSLATSLSKPKTETKPPSRPQFFNTKRKEKMEVEEPDVEAIEVDEDHPPSPPEFTESVDDEEEKPVKPSPSVRPTFSKGKGSTVAKPTSKPTSKKFPPAQEDADEDAPEMEVDDVDGDTSEMEVDGDTSEKKPKKISRPTPSTGRGRGRGRGATTGTGRKVSTVKGLIEPLSLADVSRDEKLPGFRYAYTEKQGSRYILPSLGRKYDETHSNIEEESLKQTPTKASASSDVTKAKDYVKVLTGRTVKKSKAKEEYELLAYQEEHVEEALEILENFGTFISSSAQRTGKSFISMELYFRLKLPHMLVICPNNVVETWKDYFYKYGINGTAISYTNIRGTAGHPLKNNILTRSDIKGPGRGKEIRFEPTEVFKTLIREGCLLVIDEFHHVKNASAQFLAVAALASYVSRASNTRSRNVLLSGTPPDKKSSAENVLYIAGIITSRKLSLANVDHRTGLRHTPELNRLTAYARSIDPTTTNKIVRGFNLETLPNKEFTSAVHEYVHELYVKVILPTFNRSMFPPDDNKDNHLIVIKTLSMNNAEKKAYIAGVNMLAEELGFDKESGQITNVGLGQTNNALVAVEKAKSHAACRDAKKHLDEDPNCKVVMAFNYKQSINLAAEFFTSVGIPFHTLVGDTPKNDRPAIVEEFQQDDNEIRVIICNVNVIKEGISLADMSGNHFRYAYISPSLTLSVTRQSTSRVANYISPDSRSHTMIIFGPPGNDDEIRMRSSLYDKDKTMEQSFESSQRHNFLSLRFMPVEDENGVISEPTREEEEGEGEEGEGEEGEE